MLQGERDVVGLTRQLLAFDTINPPGQEIHCINFCASWLENIGFNCEVHRHSETRGSLIATRGDRGVPSLCFSGHLDTVPLGDAAWRHPAFEGQIEGDKLFGRGASDMKGAIAAFMIACRKTIPIKGGIAILLTAGEETGCDGARWLTEAGALPDAGAIIVGESSENRPMAGHKGAYWLKVATSGLTAHGATPELGINAIEKMAPLMTLLSELDFGIRHPVMGAATCNIGTVHGGRNINSVPDCCELTLDLRSIEGISHSEMSRRIKKIVGEQATIEVLLDVPPVWSDPGKGWFANAVQTISSVTGQTYLPEVASYFTDAAILKPAMGDLPVMILGPGSLDQPHRTDEYVLVSRLLEAVDIYSALLRDLDGRRSCC